jgi:hypothetical protein
VIFFFSGLTEMLFFRRGFGRYSMVVYWSVATVCTALDYGLADASRGEALRSGAKTL